MRCIYKDKSKFNLSIDIIMLLLLMPIAGIGFLIKYVLIPGMDRNVLYGNNVGLEFWSLTRHQWGTIHLILSLIFLALLLLHIVLHFKMITCVFRKMFPNRILRIVLTTFLTVSGLLMFSFALIVKPEIVFREPLHQNRLERNSNMNAGFSEKDGLSKQVNATLVDINKDKKSKSDKNHHHSANEAYEVYGSQTLQFVADKYHVPANKIASDLKIPKELTGEKLGRLKKRYSFTMDDVRNSISKNKQ